MVGCNSILVWTYRTSLTRWNNLLAFSPSLPPQDGSQLFRQRLHETAVLSVSCSSRQVSPAAEEELTVVFEDAVAVLDGFSLYQTLRACRNQLARGEGRRTDG